MAKGLACKLGLAVNALYLVGWMVALVGLAISQDWCKDNLPFLRMTDAALPGGLPHYTFLSHELGTECRQLYRMPWFVWCLSTLPVLLCVGHLLKPSLVRRGSAALTAVLAALQILMTDTFHNLTHSNLADAVHKVEKGNQVVTVGFALLAAMSLLIIILESIMPTEEQVVKVGDHGGKVETHHTQV